MGDDNRIIFRIRED